jgi:hypothetical protein
VGNRYNGIGEIGYLRKWTTEDVVIEIPVQNVFNISPDKYGISTLESLTLRNWNVKMNLNFQNRIIGNDPNNHFEVFMFETCHF